MPLSYDEFVLKEVNKLKNNSEINNLLNPVLNNFLAVSKFISKFVEEQKLPNSFKHLFSNPIEFNELVSVKNVWPPNPDVREWVKNVAENPPTDEQIIDFGLETVKVAVGGWKNIKSIENFLYSEAPTFFQNEKFLLVDLWNKGFVNHSYRRQFPKESENWIIKSETTYSQEAMRNMCKLLYVQSFYDTEEIISEWKELVPISNIESKLLLRLRQTPNSHVQNRLYEKIFEVFLNIRNNNNKSLQETALLAIYKHLEKAKSLPSGSMKQWKEYIDSIKNIRAIVEKQNFDVSQLNEEVIDTFHEARRVIDYTREDSMEKVKSYLWEVVTNKLVQTIVEQRYTELYKPEVVKNSVAVSSETLILTEQRQEELEEDDSDVQNQSLEPQQRHSEIKNQDELESNNASCCSIS